MKEIKLNTLLGNFWEKVVANSLDSLSVVYEQSPDLGAGIISPDFVCRKQKTTIFVTCTGTRESFIKKRWRYINELFQAKGVLGDKMFVANLVLASSGNLQDIEEKVFKGLFDLAAFGEEFADFINHYMWARGELSSGRPVADVASEFILSANSTNFRQDLRKWLDSALKAKPKRLLGLWAKVTKYQGARTLKPIIPHQPTYWRWSCLKMLPLTTSERQSVLKGFKGKPIKANQDRLKCAGICSTKSIGGVRVSDHAIEASLKVFTQGQILATLDTLDVDNSSIRFPLNEVVDESSVKTAFARCKTGLVDISAFNSFAKAEYHSSRSERISIWEYGVALADTSLLDINKAYVKLWGKIVVANPINNVILKTEISKTIEQKGDIDEIIERASQIIWSRMPSAITEKLFVEKVMDYRRRSLFLQPYLNPTQRRFESVCTSALGLAPTLTNQDGLLGDVGIKGRASRVEAIYVLKREDTLWIFKVLSGYKGGYEHKADEMASRAWLLRFRWDAKHAKAWVAPVRLVFVYEGEWDEKYLSLLHASGWDDVVHLSQIESFMKGMPS